MASMFGSPWNLGQGIVAGSPGPGGAPAGGGGFPGVFPTAGPSNSGWAGWGGVFGDVGVVCNEQAIKEARCVVAPPQFGH